MNKRAKLKQNIGFTDIGMGIPYEAPTSTLFSFAPSPPMFLSNSSVYVQREVFFLWNGEDRYSLPCPSSSFPTLFSKVSRNAAGLQHLCPKQHKAGRHQPGTHRQWWMSQPHRKSRTILQIAFSEVLLRLRLCTGNIETCSFSSFLVKSSWSETRSNFHSHSSLLLTVLATSTFPEDATDREEFPDN